MGEFVRELPVTTPVVDDFMIPIFIVMQGYRVVYAENAVAYEQAVDDMFHEFKRRIRIGARNYHGIQYYWKLLLPWKGFVAFGLWSHKLLRWFAPFFLIAIFVATILLSGNRFYLWLLYGELLFIIFAVTGILLNILKIRIKLLSYFAYGFLLNLGLFIGFFKFLFRLQKPTWESTPRPEK